MPARPRAREAALGALLVLASGLVVLVAGEVVCRLFFPDERLEYVTHDEALYHFRPDQVGVAPLSDGSASPPARINALGLRGPELDPRAEHRVLVLGDSFTFGVGVADDETFAARLDRALGDAVQVVNGGQPGYGVFQMQATLARVAPEVQPDLVVVVLWQGDLLRQPPDQERRRAMERQFRIFRLVKKSVFVTHVYRRFERLLLRFDLRRIIPRVGEVDAPASSDPAALRAHLEGLEADAPRLRAMAAEARERGRGLLLVLWTKEGYAFDAEPGLAARLSEELSGLAERAGIRFLSLQGTLAPALPRRLMLPNDAHPSALGHCLVARALLPEVAAFGYEPAAPPACGPP